MKKKLSRLLLFFFCFNLASAQTVYDNYIDGKVYVKFKRAALKPVLKDDPNNLGFTKIRPIADLAGKYGITKANLPFYQASDDAHLPYIVKLHFSNASQVETLIRELQELPEVEYAEKVSLMKTDATTPNDFAISTASVHLAQIGAQNAWDYFNGSSNIRVAVVDNAVQWSHVDLAPNTYTNTVEANGITGVDDDGNGYIDDINGYNVADGNNNANPLQPNVHFHGTLCAGIACARTDNNLGVASIGWNLTLIPVQSEPDNSSSTVNVTYGYEGIIYAVKAKARVISCSWGNHVAPAQTEQYAIDYAWNRGCIIIASAGNLGNTAPIYPGSYNHVYCVAAVDPGDVKWNNSNYGTYVDICAPGSNIYTTMSYASVPAYGSFSGTSMAAPMVAGLAGLMLSKSPAMTQTAVLNCISSTAANIYTLGANSAYVTGNLLGAGRINAHAAMICAASYSAVPPVANFYAFLPNTCPNTPIPFIDSSLYVPTSWSWAFQGGTPATSTSSNPSVQWSTPGTYSVSLTVSNANGSSSITKLSYITITGPASLPFVEGFQSTTFLPAGWIANNLWNDNLYWERATGVGGFGTSTACAKFNNYDYNAPGERDEMRSPKFDFSNVANVQLRFDVAYARFNASFADSLEVKMSTNCGTSWSTIYYKGSSGLATAPDFQSGPFVPSANQWRTEFINVSALAAGQTNVMFSFINHGRFGQVIYVDNINLAFPTPTLNTVNVNTICITPAYTFSNTSQGAASYTWNFQGGTPATSTASNPSVSYASPGTYTYSLAGTNGTATAITTKTINVAPEVTLSVSSGTYCSAQSYTLTGTGATSYLWSDATGAIGFLPTLVFTRSASTTFTLTGSNAACSAESVYTINVIPTPTLVTNVQNVCAGSSATLSASGASSYSWSTGATTSVISIGQAQNDVYTVTGTTGSCASQKTIALNVYPNPTAVVTITNAVCITCNDGALEANVSGGSAPYSFTWMPSGGNAALASQLLPGCYTVSISDANACVTESVACVDFPNGITQQLSEHVKIYPNPASETLSIELPGRSYTYALYTTLGQLILSEKEGYDSSVIRLHSFAKGVYLLQLESEGLVIRKKIVVE